MGLHGSNTLVELVCCACGVRFGIDAVYYDQDLANHQGGLRFKESDGTKSDGWYCCPHGHRQRRRDNADEERRKRLVELSRKLETMEAENAKLKRTVARDGRVTITNDVQKTRRDRTKPASGAIRDGA
jgi:hypothetical protein